jgi:hypothetical protein
MCLLSFVFFAVNSPGRASYQPRYALATGCSLLFQPIQYEELETEESHMHGLLICGLLSLTPFNESQPAWLKDYGQAKEQALREDKPIFAVFR